MSNPRHAVPSRTAFLAGRIALGVVGAPVAMLAVAGPASAVELDSFDASDNRVELSAEDNVLDADAEMSELALPELELPGTESVPGFDSVDVMGLSALGLPAPDGDSDDSATALPALDTLPGTDSFPGLDALPGTDAFPGTDALGEFAELPVDLNLDLDVDLPEAPDLPEGFDVPEGTDLPEGFDLPEGADLPGGTDVFAVSDLLGGIV